MIVSWNTTNRCNMYCDHCYRESGEAQNGELTTDEGKKLIDEIALAGFKIMIFSGGEPLMRPDIFELVEHATKRKLRPVFGTNGTYITSEVAKRLKDAGAMAMGISLDSSNPTKHNEFRKYAKAWEEAVEGMKNCKEAGLPFQIHTTVMNWNKDEILQITDLAMDLGARGHHIFFLVPTGRGENLEDEYLSRNEYEAILTKVMEKAKTSPIEIKPTCAPQFMRVGDELGVPTKYSKGCLAGISYCIISPAGDVQPCAYMKNYLGNVREIPFHKIWSENSVLKELRTMDYKGNCGQCSYKNTCGGCRARAAISNNGDYMASDMLCRLNS